MNEENNLTPETNASEETIELKMDNTEAAAEPTPVTEEPTPIENPVAPPPDIQPQVSTTPPPKKKSALPIVLLIVVAVAALGIFVVAPFIKKNFMSTPKNVFESSIKTAVKKFNTTLTETNFGSSMYDVNIKIDTNVEGLKELSGYTFGINGGYNQNDRLIEAKLYTIDKSNKEISGTGYVKNDTVYYKLSTDNRIIKAATLEDLGMKEIFDQVKQNSINDYTYLTEKVATLLIENFTDKDFTKEETTLKVNGKEITVTKNNYVLTKDKVKTISKHIAEGIYNDEKAINIITNDDYTKEDFKKEIDEMNYDDIEDDLNIPINLYTNKNGDVIGVDITVDNVKNYYYTNDGEIESFIKSDEEEIKITGVKDGNNTNVTITTNNEAFAKLVVKEFDEHNIVFDYELFPDETETKVTGSIDYRSPKANTFSLKIAAKSGNEQITATINVNEEQNAKIANIDTNSAIELNEEEQMTLLNNFMNELDKSIPIKKFAESIMYSGNTYMDYDDDYYSYYDDDEDGF